jgi:hypothetical protein
MRIERKIRDGHSDEGNRFEANTGRAILGALEPRLAA